MQVSVMMQVDQTLFNIIITVAGILCGWVLNNMWSAIKDLEKSDKELNTRIGATETLVAGQYVKRDEFREDMRGLETKIDKIADRLGVK